MRRILVTMALVVSLTASSWAAEIIVEPNVEPYKLIDVQTPTEGTGFAWFILGPRGMERWVPTGPLNQNIAFTGPPGKYTVMLVVQIKGGGLDQGFATVVIGGEEPDPEPEPNPIPPPPPPIEEELWGFIIIEESADRTPQLAAILTSTEVFNYLESSGLNHKIADPDVTDESGKIPDDMKPYIEDAKDEGMPMLFIMGTEGGEFFRGPVPKTSKALIALLEKYMEVQSP